MLLDKEPGTLYPVLTKGGGNSDSAWSIINEYNTPLLQKIYYVCNRPGEIQPLVVKAYVVPGLNYDLLLVNVLNQAGYAVHHHQDPEQLKSDVVMVAQAWLAIQQRFRGKRGACP